MLATFQASQRIANHYVHVIGFIPLITSEVRGYCIYVSKSAVDFMRLNARPLCIMICLTAVKNTCHWVKSEREIHCAVLQSRFTTDVQLFAELDYISGTSGAEEYSRDSIIQFVRSKNWIVKETSNNSTKETKTVRIVVIFEYKFKYKYIITYVICTVCNRPLWRL